MFRRDLVSRRRRRDVACLQGSAHETPTLRQISLPGMWVGFARINEQCHVSPQLIAIKLGYLIVTSMAFHK